MFSGFPWAVHVIASINQGDGQESLIIKTWLNERENLIKSELSLEYKKFCFISNLKDFSPRSERGKKGIFLSAHQDPILELRNLRTPKVYDFLKVT